MKLIVFSVLKRIYADYWLNSSIRSLIIDIMILSGLNVHSQARLITSKHISGFIFIKTVDIKYNAKPKGMWRKNYKGHLVLEGDWDIDNDIIIPMSQSRTMQQHAVRQLFVENIPYKDCGQYQYLLKFIYNKELPQDNDYGSVRKKIRDIADLDKYHEDLISAYNSIKTNGYKTHEELENTIDDEIKINVNRYGEFILGSGGNHRYEIAKILNIEIIPVVVQHIHYDYAISLTDKYGMGVKDSINKWLSEIDRKNEFYNGMSQ